MSEPVRTPAADDSPSSPGSDRRALLAGLGGLAAGAVLIRPAHAGPLNPPAGPVASTGKTLLEVEPRIAINATNTRGDADSVYKISQPGSYYLTGNVTGATAKHAIEIAADNVTIDLMGFTLQGVPGSLDGIAATGSPRRSISIRNGVVRDFGGDGVDLIEGGAPGDTARIEHIQALGNAGYGIRVWDNAVVSQCSAVANGLVGIFANAVCAVEACTAIQNGNAGIFCFEDSSVSGCSARLNAAYGIGASIGCSVAHCASGENAEHGFAVGQGCTIAACAAFSNTMHGISAVTGNLICANACDRNGAAGAGIYLFGASNRVEDNNCTRADRGIQAVSNNGSNIILRNSCSQNTINWDIVPGNSVAPIIAAGVNAGPISGNTFAGSLGSSDPHANFTY